MKPLYLLLAVFLISAAFFKLIYADWSIMVSGNIAMCAMMVFASIGHFKFKDGMAMMLPPFLPAKKMIVVGTGVLEILLGMALLFSNYRRLAGIVLIAFLIMVLPANIYAAQKNVDLEKAAYTGKGTSYLWVRIPLQLFFIIWVYYFSVSNFCNIN